MTYLAVPIAAKDADQAKRQIKAAIAAGAEMLELRTDYLENLTVDLVKDLIAKARSKTGQKLPLIATCRDARQGGEIDYPLQLRIDVLASALKAGADFIDIEFENFIPTENREKIEVALSQTSKARLILSAHNFEGKFDNIEKLHRQILAVYPAAIPKLIYTANHINDCFQAFDLLHRTGSNAIIFSMGAAGLITRIIAKKLGSFVTYASIDDKSATAPGQLTIEQLKKIYRWDSINPNTELYGLIGSPVAHSLSPVLHNACFADIAANKLYLPLLVEGGKDGFNKFMNNVLGRAWLGFRGFSITIPHKRNALDYTIDSRGVVEPLAKKIGAVNTLLIDERRATSGERRLSAVASAKAEVSAYNTDYAGAMDAITSTLGPKANLKDLPVAIIGAGGAARAIVAGLTDAGAKIKIYNRTVEKAEKLAAEFNCNFAGLDDLPNVDAKLLINATSIGMHPDIDATPLPKEYIKKDMVVFDTIYNPPQTLFLKQAKAKKAKTISGLSMFINQAAAQFKLFTGQDADPKLMRKVVDEKFNR
jgi:3-dehydroquinate dehydratase/shikimate dehydrogenase